MRPLEDFDLRTNLVEEVNNLVTREHDGHVVLRKREGWNAVPVQSAAHFSPSQMKNIAASYRQTGTDTLFAVLLEPLRHVPIVHVVDASEAGIAAFTRTLAHFNVALYSPQSASLVVCTTDDYFVVAGGERFVRAALGVPVEQAFEDFAVYAANEGWRESDQRTFASMLATLRDVYPRLRAGDAVTLP
jgi:hypothetical protein